jgi:hypothetical protein
MPTADQSDPLTHVNWDEPGAIKVDLPPHERRPRRRRRRIAAGGGGAVIAAVIAALAIPGVRNQLPADVPVIGKDASSVWAQIQDSGLAVTDGEPSAAKFRQLVHHNACKSSHSFVQSEGDSGWALICVKPPRSAYREMRKSMDGVPALLAPMWVDQNGGEVVIFGMGWPGKASEQIADAIGGDTEFVTFDSSGDY